MTTQQPPPHHSNHGISSSSQSMHETAPLPTQSNLSRLTSQIQQLQNQSQSQSLVIKNLSSMMKVLLGDFQNLKQDNRTLKRILWELTNGDERYFSSSKSAGHSSSANVSSGNSSRHSTKKDVGAASQSETDASWDNQEDVLRSSAFTHQQQHNKSRHKNQSKTSTFFDDSSKDSDIFSTNHPTNSTHSYLFEKNETFSSAHDSSGASSSDQSNYSSAAHSASSEEAGSNVYDHFLSSSTSYAFVPGKSANSSSRNVPDPSPFKFPGESDTPGQSIRSPFIHNKFEEFLNKQQSAKRTEPSSTTAEADNGKDTSFNSDATTASSSSCKEGASQVPRPFTERKSSSASPSEPTSRVPTSPKTPKTPKRTHVAHNSFEKSFSSPLFGNSRTTTRKSSEPTTPKSAPTTSQNPFASPPNSASKKGYQFSYDMDSEDEDVTPFCRLKEEGKKLFHEGRYSEAYAKFTESLALHKNGDAKLRSNLFYKRAFIALKMMRNHMLCLAECTKALEINPTYYKANLCKGDCLLVMKEYGEAVEAFRAARNLKFTELARARLKYAKRLYKEQMAKSSTSSSNHHHHHKRSSSSSFSSSSFSSGNKENTDTSNKKHRSGTPSKSPKEELSHYETLGVPNHTKDEAMIKKAYKKLARQWHPDRFVEDKSQQQVAEEKFKKVAEAYRILKDDKEKLKYDTLLLRKRRKRAYSSFL